MVSNIDDYYELLGISRSAGDKEIKSAYKKAARKYHPDNAETGNEEIFKKLGEAYDVLRDPQKRALYDQYGKEGLKGAAGGGFGGFGGFSGTAGFEDLSDIFSSFFGGGFSGAAGGRRAQRGPRQSRGEDQVVDVSLNFLDPKSSVKKKIKLNPLSTCKTCNGKGAEKPEDIVTCSQCEGSGQVVIVQNTFLGQVRQAMTCPTCQGSGQEIKNKCNTCKGRGLKREEKEVEITIPAGIYDGANMRLSGIGDAGRNGGPAGDIYLNIHVKDHPVLKRDGAEVYSQIEIDFTQAALGAKLNIETINGIKTLELKPGTQAGTVETLKTEGFPKINNPARQGDHHLSILIKTPTNLTSKEKELLRELQKLRQEKKN